MTNADRHIKQWLHNRRYISTIPAEFHDWIITAAFYTALHAVDTLLAHENVANVVNHDTRNDVLARTHRYTHTSTSTTSRCTRCRARSGISRIRPLGFPTLTFNREC